MGKLKRILLGMGMLLCVYPMISSLIMKEKNKWEPVSDEAIGQLIIPKIDSNLPIYNGTEEEVLQKGVGHIIGSSLPNEGPDSHSLLAGHRGLPGAQLLAGLGEIEVGDMFYIQLEKETLIYEVRCITVIKPEETECLRIQPGKELVSLITCTPYGFHTHRLVVTGERREKL